MKHTIAGIDIGCETTRIVVAEQGSTAYPRVIGYGSAKTHGMRHGYVTNPEKVSASIREAIVDAQKRSGARIRRAYLALSSQSLSTDIVETSVIISKGDGEVTYLDVDKLLEKAEHTLLSQKKNRHILHTLPVKFMLDGKEVFGRPLGLFGVKLEAQILFVTTLSHHFDDLVHVATDAGIDVLEVIASPVALSIPLLSEKQKTVGVALIAIGSETTHISVFENDTLVGIKTLPIGTSDVTNDIALGLKVSLEEADHIKRESTSERAQMPLKKIAPIIEARLADIYELVEKYLKQLKRSELLPAGVVIAGGGSLLPFIEELAKGELNLPTHIADKKDIHPQAARVLPDTTWLTAYGLCYLDGTQSPAFQTHPIGKTLRSTKQFFQNLFDQFMP